MRGLLYFGVVFAVLALIFAPGCSERGPAPAAAQEGARQIHSPCDKHGGFLTYHAVVNNGYNQNYNSAVCADHTAWEW